MVESKEYISEAQAASIAGVSVNTLARFAETGHLRTETDVKGSRLFSKIQIQELFGLKVISSPAATRPGKSVRSPRQGTVQSESRAMPAGSNGVHAKQRKSAQSRQVQPPPLQHQSTRQPAQQQTVKRPVSRQGNIELIYRAALQKKEREIVRLTNLCDMQEKLIDIRDGQVKELNQERDWLRTRVERLEDKSHRDQLLMLSEKQTIKKLIDQQQQKRSTMQLALEWLGFSSPSQTSSEQASSNDQLSTIEIQQEKSDPAAMKRQPEEPKVYSMGGSK